MKSTNDDESNEPIRVSVLDAQERLSELAHAAQRGQTVFIERKDESGLTVLRLVPVPQRRYQPRKAGGAKRLIESMADAFDAPLEDLREYIEPSTPEEHMRKPEGG